MGNFAVVGGGILGMTTALRLSQLNHQVTIYESEDRLGGLAGSVRMNGCTWDRFYHVILKSDTATLSLIKELGLENELKWVETKTGFYVGGRLYSMSNSLEFLKFPPLSLYGKFRLGLTILYASKIKNWERLEKIPVSKWLRFWSGKETFEKIWSPLLRAKLGDMYTQTSAAFIWATIQRMYAARRSGLKKEMFGYVEGGYARVLDKFTEKLIQNNVSINCNSRIVQIETEDRRKIRITTERNHQKTFDKVILTLPSSEISRICPSLEEQEHRKLKSINYMGVICPHVLLSRSISPYYVTNITDSWVPFTGVIEMTALIDKKETHGKSLIYLPMYVNQTHTFWDLNEEQIKKQALDALFKMYPFLKPEEVEYTGLCKAPFVFGLPDLNYSQKLIPAKTSVKGIYIINSSFIMNGTSNVNETIQLVDKNLQTVTQNEK